MPLTSSRVRPLLGAPGDGAVDDAQLRPVGGGEHRRDPEGGRHAFAGEDEGRMLDDHVVHGYPSGDELKKVEPCDHVLGIERLAGGEREADLAEHHARRGEKANRRLAENLHLLARRTGKRLRRHPPQLGGRDQERQHRHGDEQQRGPRAQHGCSDEPGPAGVLADTQHEDTEVSEGAGGAMRATPEATLDRGRTLAGSVSL